MKRVALLFLFVTALEWVAFRIHRNHPLVWPEYFSTVLLVIALVTCWAGIEAARWLLRTSPAARMPGPISDWTRLWVWIGPVGGALLCLGCLLGSLANKISPSHLAGFLVVGHFSGGALAWVAALPWAAPDLYRDPDAGYVEKTLLNLGLFTHALGFLTFFLVYPGTHPEFSIGWLLASAYFFNFILYYLMVSVLCWAAIFRFWRPVVEDDIEPGIEVLDIEEDEE
ncbi:MAG: hypothetical protein HY319_25500 [Armatimonadetes bacterium]|nr:hypothetical protein [Armatimonadota bacterium]